MNISEILTLKTAGGIYNITVGDDILASADKFMNLNRKVLIVTDSGVPIEYANTVAALCKDARVLVIEQGEENKNIGTYEKILRAMLDFGMNRKDAALAVGGGVVGDITGFAAACYMRGIDFYNIPTTLLSQVDSSIGGKCAIDFMGAKNIVGAFWQPKAVIIDTAVLSTLPERQISAGMAEVIKMAATSDAELFSALGNYTVKDNIKEIILGALKIKRAVVEADEKEGSIRKILNFGHTFGHGIEAVSGLYHGECVALGMLPMCGDEARVKIEALLKKYGLAVAYDFDIDDALKFMQHDKKASASGVSAIIVDKIGNGKITDISFAELTERIMSFYNRQ